MSAVERRDTPMTHLMPYLLELTVTNRTTLPQRRTFALHGVSSIRVSKTKTQRNTAQPSSPSQMADDQTQSLHRLHDSLSLGHRFKTKTQRWTFASRAFGGISVSKTKSPRWSSCYAALVLVACPRRRLEGKLSRYAPILPLVCP